jgi:hypothetical protein
MGAHALRRESHRAQRMPAGGTGGSGPAGISDDCEIRSKSVKAVDIVNTNFSELPAFPPDAARYPLFQQAACAEVHLEPGDMLYMPRRWWHWVTSFERNIAINVWHAAERTSGKLPSDQSAPTEIPTLSDPAEFKARYFQPREPVRIRTPELQRWPAFSRWTDDYLEARSGAASYLVGVSPDPQLFPFKGAHRTRGEQLTLGQFLKRSRESTGEHLYLAQNEALPRLLAEDWSIPGFWRDCFEDAAFRVPMWLTFAGEQGVTSALHFDYYENVLIQIAGRKRVLLFSPSQTPYLYRIAAEHMNAQRQAQG